MILLNGAFELCGWNTSILHNWGEIECKCIELLKEKGKLGLSLRFLQNGGHTNGYHRIWWSHPSMRKTFVGKNTPNSHEIPSVQKGPKLLYSWLEKC
jgi:hypothetical protein